MTGATGLSVTQLDRESTAAWFDGLITELSHNLQLDASIHAHASGLLFATDELLAVSQLSNRVMAMSDLLADLLTAGPVAVPGGLNLGLASALPGELSTQRARELPTSGTTTKAAKRSPPPSSSGASTTLLPLRCRTNNLVSSI